MPVTIDNDNIVGCCAQYNPCEVVCLLQNAYADLLLGKKNRSYRIGEEQFVIYQPTLANIESGITHFQSLCNLSQGKPSRARARICMIAGRHVCPSCRRSSCRCK